MNAGDGKDPYCFPGTTVLRNRLDIRDEARLGEAEAILTQLRAEEPLPVGAFDPAHHRALHRHLFQDVYDWAGDYRTVRLSKGGSTFCFPEHIDAEMQKLFTASPPDWFRVAGLDEFASRLAHFLAELNAIHPFREGNGRTQLLFASLIAEENGRQLAYERMDAAEMMAAMIASFRGDEAPLAAIIRAIVETEDR
jgi:cell filamentation protein